MQSAVVLWIVLRVFAVGIEDELSDSQFGVRLPQQVHGLGGDLHRVGLPGPGHAEEGRATLEQVRGIDPHPHLNGTGIGWVHPIGGCESGPGDGNPHIRAGPNAESR